MNPATRAVVRQRAFDRCEYCGLPQNDHPLAFHVEHVRARQHGGNDDPSNLAWACNRCNFFKGPNLSCVDPDSGAVVLIFNPRADSWNAHFRIDGLFVRGLTPVGRGTVQLLQMNDDERLRVRAATRRV